MALCFFKQGYCTSTWARCLEPCTDHKQQHLHMKTSNAQLHWFAFIQRHSKQWGLSELRDCENDKIAIGVHSVCTVRVKLEQLLFA